MKNILYLLLSGLLITTSCSEDFLKEDIAVNREIDSFYKTPGEINGALIDAYNVLQREPYANARWAYGDVASTDAIKGGESNGDFADLEQIVEDRPLATNSLVKGLWTSAFSGITKANIIIDKIDKVAEFGTDDASQKLKQRYRAEAQFLRAFNYWYIAMAYGDAPLLTSGITDFSEIDPKLLERKPVEEVWTLVEKDLKEAIPNLATQSELATNNELGRASKGAAQALLAKALMFQRKYDEAVPVLKDLVENGGYSLVSDYGALFRPEGEFSSENIFEVNFITQGSGWGEDCEGSIRYVYQMSRDDWGWGFNQPTQDLANEFETGDPRIIYTLNWPKDQYVAGVEQKNSQNNPYGYHSRKVFQLPAERPASQSCAGQNEVVFRLADMYLLYAEALLQSSAKDVNTALAYVNKVRERANNTPKFDPERVFQYYNVANTELSMRTYTTDEQLLNHIWHERRVELAMEGIRWWDMVRQGRTDLLDEYYQNWGIKKGFAEKGDLTGKFYTQWLNQLGRTEYPVYPVPQSEVDASQGYLKQTQGY